MGFTAFNPSYESVISRNPEYDSNFVGWVERSETHQFPGFEKAPISSLMGFTAFNPSYESAVLIPSWFASTLPLIPSRRREGRRKREYRISNKECRILRVYLGVLRFLVRHSIFDLGFVFSLSLRRPSSVAGLLRRVEERVWVRVKRAASDTHPYIILGESGKKQPPRACAREGPIKPRGA